MLGGSAVHFALAASFFTDVRVVGPGRRRLRRRAARAARRARDRDRRHRARRGRRDVLLARPLRPRHERRPHRRHAAQRLRRLRAEALAGVVRRPTCCSSATSSPTSSATSARQSSAEFAALDSMNLWIDTARDSLVAAIGEVDCLLLNDAELRMLTGEPNLVTAAQATMDDGPERGRRQARRVRRGAVHRGRVRSRSRGCRSRRSATRPAPATASPAASSATSTAPAIARHLRRRGAAAGDGLRVGDGLVQRRGLRHRARQPRHGPPSSASAIEDFKRLMTFDDAGVRSPGG